MKLADEYRRQFAWRSWMQVFAALPALAGQTVLDLGCGVGDQAAELVGRGASVLGFDTNEELLREARAMRLPHAEFREADLRALPALPTPADGLWCSFATAYFPDLAPVLAAWSRQVRAGAWIALTEIDDLFAHEPLEPTAASLLAGYAQEALAAGRYDFKMGRKLADHVQRAGFTVGKVLTLADQEFSCHGPAQPSVVEAWRTRFDRMGLLREFCGTQFEQVRDEFLQCLVREDHRSAAKVTCCIATKS
ncbi:MAG TPA: class I SAM-dependent methyltransferase [Planctomycetota bacterium]